MTIVRRRECSRLLLLLNVQKKVQLFYSCMIKNRIFACVGLIIVFMSKNEKLIERFRQFPRDFTFEELEKHEV